MSFNHEQPRAELSEKLIAMAHSKLAKAEADLLSKFIPYFLLSVDTEEMGLREIDDLFGALYTSWQLVYQRKPGETNLRIFNPELNSHGWQSSHTVIALAHDDMPFLVDSLQIELNRRGMTCYIIFHAGGIQLIRDAENKVIDVLPMGKTQHDAKPEAIVYIEIARQANPQVLEDLHQSCQHILRDVELAVEDWQPIMTKVKETVFSMQQQPPLLDSKEILETSAFLQWLLDGHFIFLGYREYNIIQEQGDKTLTAVPGSGLGVLRDNTGKHSRAFSSMPLEAQHIALSPHLLIIAKSNTISTVHRAANTDIIGIKLFNDKGEVTGERRIIGLYTSVAYHSRPHGIPVLREKVSEVMLKSHFSPYGHAGKALLNILETLPRDDLFQASVDELLHLGMGILYMQDRRDIRLFVRKDVYGRFLSCLVYVPKDRFNTELREKFEKILAKEFNAKDISYNTLVTDAVLARIHFMVYIEPTQDLIFDVKAIEYKLTEAARSWQEDLNDAINNYFGESRFTELAAYLRAFPAGYRENNTVEIAIEDIQHIETLNMPGAISMNLMQSVDAPSHNLRFKLYRKNTPVSLSDALPILENMGLRVLSEEPYRINLIEGNTAWISEFDMELRQDFLGSLAQIKGLFQDAFASTWFGKTENDGFNRLVLAARLTWQEITVLRAYAKYFKQIGFTFSQTYIEEILSKHANISGLLVQLFSLRFDPHYAGDRDRNTAMDETEKAILKALDNVSNLDEDKILRRYLELIKATLRTNYFQRNAEGLPKDYLSLKFNPEQISELPLPRPMFEIWVYSPSVEGVHLRSSKVARGGLRWSDRREDFRTEVLGLMKAQKVKNAVIVPSGAKGGFVPKTNLIDASREEILQEGIRCYRIFIRGLLDITDNLVAGEVVYPPEVVRYDEDDTYLVVAADKGTATFSNFANEIAAEYHFWLDDAFASGGATGYDHKKMGITAKGAWESTKRHFRELGLDTQTQDFTVVGIGDLAGDVFGNGMLQSKHIKLLAAFNHMHIFIDPHPNTLTSFGERERIFNLPRSSWEDYNPELISAGGGVFKRSLKFITLTPEIKAVFGIEKDTIEPNELIRIILKSKVDLLWNGGIGTFVKASQEINEYVGDKTNDPIRINGRELGCRVVVEGGNLGFTQLGRIEYALKGGQIYTDFIDNSAGVDCSDHEVNIKILLNGLVLRDEMTLKQRNDLLLAMTDEVGSLVLRDNYMQTQALSIATHQAEKNHDLYVRFMADMIDSGKLDRDIEFLPDDKQLQERKGLGQSFTAPEMAVLLAYSKMILKEKILLSDLPEDASLSEVIATAFPAEISRDYRQAMLNHSLRREIIATQVSSFIVNYMGMTFVDRIVEETGASIASIIRAYMIAYSVFDAGKLWHAIESLDYQVNIDVQYDMMQSMTRLLRRATRWFLRNHRNDLTDLAGVVTLYKDKVDQFYHNMPQLLSGTAKQYYDNFYQNYHEAGVPEALAKQVSITIAMYAALDIIAASHEYRFNCKQTAEVYFKLGASLELGWLRANIINEVEETHWDALGKAALRDDIDLQHRELALAVMSLANKQEDTNKILHSWMDTHQAVVGRWQRIILSLKSTNNVTFVMHAVAVRELFELVQASKLSMKEAAV